MFSLQSGKWYLKIISGYESAEVLHTPAQLVRSFRFGHHNHVNQFLRDKLRKDLPGTE